MLIWYIIFDTSHTQPRQSVPYSSQSLTVGNKSVHCQSYDSACTNKHFTMNAVTQFPVARLYTVRTASSRLRSCVLTATFLPPAIGQRSAIMLHEMHSVEHSRTAMSQFSILNRISLVAAFAQFIIFLERFQPHSLLHSVISIQTVNKRSNDHIV